MTSIWQRTISKEKILAFIIGVGIALTPIHNTWLTNLVKDNGEVSFFIPSFGVALWFIGSLMFVVYYWGKINWGEKRIYIPLAIIVCAMTITGINEETIGGKITPFFMGISLFSLYLAARIIGRDILIPLAVGVAVASLGSIVYGLIYRIIPSGGYVFDSNYDILAGYVLLGLALFIHRWQKWLAMLSLSAMLLSGSPEAFFVLCIVGIAVLYRRDWSKKLIYVLTPVVILIAIWMGVGWGGELYGFTYETLQMQARHTDNEVSDKMPAEIVEENNITYYRSAVGYRFLVIITELQNVKPLGTGYILTDFSRQRNVHNVPLVIVQQLGYGGIVAAIAWIWVSIYCLIKTKWKYAWITLLALCVFDHYIWTQLAPIWWVVVGASLTSNIKDDYIFKRTQIDKYTDGTIGRLKRMKEVYNNGKI